MSFTTRRIREEETSRGMTWTGAARAVLLLLRPVVSCYWAWKKRREAEERREVRLLFLKRTALVLASLLLILLLLAGVLRGLIGLRILTFQTFMHVAGKELPADTHGYTNFLLLGKGDEKHDGVDLTDTVIVASLDPRRTQSAFLLSLPRDLHIQGTKKMAEGRINELYRDYKIALKRTTELHAEEIVQEAMRELKSELSRLLRMEIHHVAMVDFIGFVKAVDAIGGVDVEVPEDIVDPEYPGPEYTYQTFEIRQGFRHLDGETALKYARSRHTTSDFDRSARQQQLLSALAAKARTEGITGSPGRMKSLWEILQENSRTTMTFGELLGTAELLSRIDQGKIIAIQLNNLNGLYSERASLGGLLYNPPRELFNGASVLLPVSIPEFPVTWKQIQLLVSLIQEHRTLFLRHPGSAILNVGAKTGLGRKLGNELTRFGFNVADITNLSTDDASGRKKILKLEHTIVVAGTEADVEDASAIATLLHLPLVPAPPELTAENRGPVTILLGEDYVYRPLQELIPLEQ